MNLENWFPTPIFLLQMKKIKNAIRAEYQCKEEKILKRRAKVDHHGR